MPPDDAAGDKANSGAAAARDRYRALAAFAAKFEAPGATFGQWVRSETRADCVMVLPYFEPGPLLLEFVRACGTHGWLRPGFDWMMWMKTPRARQLVDDPAALSEATEEEIAQLLTAVIRSDRFTEGSLNGAFESGLLGSIVKRVGALGEEDQVL